MKKKEQGKRAISRITLPVLAVLLVAWTFHSCQKDDFFEQEEPAAIALKSATSATVVYPEVFAGPASFSPVKGKIIKQTITLENLNYGDFETVFALVVRNGDDNGLNPVSGANIYVNGTQVVSMADFRKAPPVMSRVINNLEAITTIEVEAKGRTTDVLTLWIEGTFKPIPLATFTDDRDGHVYKMVTIGTQTWMAENLAYQAETGIYAYAGNEANVATYGWLYNWDAALIGCPVGWHLPSRAETVTMFDYLIANGYAFTEGGTDIAKAVASTTGWDYLEQPGCPGNDPASNNSSGFSGLPGGQRDPTGYYWGMGSSAYFWTSSENYTGSLFGIAWQIAHNYNNLFAPTTYQKREAMSVRCVKNVE